MKDFAAIDFETANGERSSVCSVGVVVVRDGEIADTFYSLIQPEPNYYTYWCSRVHGLTREDTEEAPVFSEVWKQVEPLIEGLPLVAHNKGFDEGCLKAAFKVYQMDYPDYCFTIPLPLPAGLFPVQRIISCILLLPFADTTSRCTTMPLLMPRPVHGLQERYCDTAMLWHIY